MIHQKMLKDSAKFIKISYWVRRSWVSWKWITVLRNRLLCQLNCVKELSLCCLQSCRSCVGPCMPVYVCVAPRWVGGVLFCNCKDIAVATCWSGASVKLCQTVIAFLWLTFNCCGCLALATLTISTLTLQPPHFVMPLGWAALFAGMCGRGLI